MMYCTKGRAMDQSLYPTMCPAKYRVPASRHQQKGCCLGNASKKTPMFRF